MEPKFDGQECAGGNFRQIIKLLN